VLRKPAPGRCRKCFRTFQIQKADAFRLHGQPAVLRDVAVRPPDQGMPAAGSGSVRLWQTSGLENGRFAAHITAMKSPDSPMSARSASTVGLLAVCAVLVGFGLLTIAVSPGFFMNLLGAGMMATGGTAAYLISSHRPAQ
jgi:hypothetical protein